MGDLWELGVQPISTLHVVELCSHDTDIRCLLTSPALMASSGLPWSPWNETCTRQQSDCTVYSPDTGTQYSSHGPSVNTGKHSRRSAGGRSNALHKTFTLICHRNSIVSALQWSVRLTNARQGKLVCHLKPHRRVGPGSPHSLQIHPLHRNLPNQRQKLRTESGPFT